MTPAGITRLEKAAIDNGFDRELPRQGDWLGFASTQVPLHIWLTAIGEDRFIAAVSQQNVVRTLVDQGAPVTDVLPPGASGALAVADIPALDRLVRRAFQLSRTLPDELLRAFEKATTGLPRATEVERLVLQRVGQEVFRAGLLDYWEGRCAITGLAVPELLRASHSMPWADCSRDAQRLDVFNGLLLAPHLDAAFDTGLITIANDDTVVVSTRLQELDRQILGLQGSLRVGRLTDEHRGYLRWHRDRVFKP